MMETEADTVRIRRGYRSDSTSAKTTSLPRRLLVQVVAGWFCLAAWQAGAAETRPRLMVLTDIGGDPDDQQSMIRLLHYANELEIEGLIASASGIPGELKEAVTKPHLIVELIDAYGQVQGSLAGHDPRYPSADSLRTLVKSGNSQRGRPAIGPEGDTEGSRWIIRAGDKEDARPLNLTIWGGQTDLGQALWRVRQDRGDMKAKAWRSRLRVYDIGDQDVLADWILETFPDLFYVLPRPRKGEDRREAVYRGMYLGGDESLTSREWVDQNIRSGHGPLGALYPTRTWTAPNPHGTLKEGDTPSWFFFLPVGLGDPNHPDWGGWGGRFVLENDRVWIDATDTVGTETHRRVTVWRWRPQFQADFQARLDWAVKPVVEANHAPHPVVNGDTSGQALVLQAKAGSGVVLDADLSTDPDKDRLSFRWWYYAEPSQGAPAPKFSGPNDSQTVVSLPAGEAGAEYHLILEVTDDGEPRLTRYRRVIVRVEGR